MSTAGQALPSLSATRSPLPQERRAPLVNSAVAGTLIFVATEAMFFVALMCAYTVIRAGSGAKWVPPENVRLPVMTTAFNTGLLLLSGVAAGAAIFTRQRGATVGRSARLLAVSALLGLAFVLVQGFEWTRLLAQGMTMVSGVFGAAFYLLVGSHALHAASAVLILAWAAVRLARRRLTDSQLAAVAIYWGFIVLVWPALYSVVYF